MPKRLIAALCAALTFAAVLAVVPLATAQPAEAHECALGQSHNGGPNGLSNPNNGHLYCWTTPTTAPKKPTTTTQPKSCPSGQHSNGGAGKNCHANHDYSKIPCGTGTWTPGHGHSAVKRPACKNGGDGHPGGADNEEEDKPADKSKDPCSDYAESLIAALNKANDGTNAKPNLPTQPAECQGSTNHDILDKIKSFFRTYGESRIENAELEEQAYETLRKKIAEIWNTELPGQDYIDAVRDHTVCATVVAVYVRTKGRAAKVPGWKKTVGWLGCDAAILQLEIHYRDAGNGGSGGDGDGGDGGTENDDEPAYDPDISGDGKISTTEFSKVLKKHADGEISDAERERIRTRYYCDLGIRSSCEQVRQQERAAQNVPGDTNRDGVVSDAEARQAEVRWQNGEIDRDELNRIHNENDCDKGYADACEALGRWAPRTTLTL